MSELPPEERELAEELANDAAALDAQQAEKIDINNPVVKTTIAGAVTALMHKYKVDESDALEAYGYLMRHYNKLLDADMTLANIEDIQKHYNGPKLQSIPKPLAIALLRLKLLVRKAPFKAEKKLGRNDPCFCGSSKKYKQCCIEKVNTAELTRYKNGD